MVTRKCGVRGFGAATAAGLAFTVGILVAVAAQQRRYGELRLRIERMERNDHQEARLAEQQ
ncbi:MAG: hypothetical protein LBV60_13020, partial [Streptomyces sp.]|nr:hypothetical protein [Streptomyces sp.]